MNIDFTPRTLTAEQIADQEQVFLAVSALPAYAEEVWGQMYDYFQQATPEDIEKVYSTYFRWYTELTWRQLNGFDVDFVVNTGIRKQIVMAIVLGHDVLRSLIWYLHFNYANAPEQMKSIYVLMQKALFESEATIGSLDGKKMFVKDVVSEMRRIEIQGDDIAKADFKSKLSHLCSGLVDPLLKQYTPFDQEATVTSFIKLATFFIHVDEDKAAYMVDAYVNGSRYAVESGYVAPTVTAPATPANKPAPVKKKEQRLVEQGAADHAAIKQTVESSFKKENDQFVDLEGVLGYLEALSQKNNDPTIKELYYFDEQDQKFKWAI